ncbi:MAG: adenosine deaminase family protein [Candidatus Wallbacteria bacterium HGW-Wallbacteria-1]|jgi:adenosine deaminase|uniref:adenosine deaminase n=1 Tax=Candidatus Wallbacteria bacterium HGW-Wallbacteria-1 TaxID=2013854 RepID=A0A2N1PRJ0_9BACT|nr:MAG: adenosine deaminase family protein [Candidatus Wallbacteria bacterium HGW-Wallbacteria-1]
MAVPNPTIDRELLLKLPKTDLHVHLDGCVDAELMVALAKDQGINLVEESNNLQIGNLTSGTVDELNEKVFLHEYNSLAEYLVPFELVNCVLRTPDALEEAAYRLAVDEFSEGVRYFEVRYAPQKHWREGFGWYDIVSSVDKGCRRAADEFNASENVRNGSEPSFNYGIILCALRMIHPNMGDYYKTLSSLHVGDDLQALSGLASYEVAKLGVECRKRGLKVVGFDLAGREDGFPPDVHKDAFDYCYMKGLQTTCHAGEAYGCESISAAIKYCGARRIGHGTQLFSLDKILRRNPNGTEMSLEEKEEYIRFTADRMSRERITLEVCLKSNSQTLPTLRDLSMHPVKKFIDYGLRVALSTDNRAISRVTVTEELLRFKDLFGMDHKLLKTLCIAGFKGAFYHGTYPEHRVYMRKMIDFFDKIMIERVGK